MGNEFVGIVHPSKLYNILTVGTPFLYIGPEPSHLSEIVANANGDYRSYSASHGDVETVVERILEQAEKQSLETVRRVPQITNEFSKEKLLPRLIELLECQVAPQTEMPSSSGSAKRLSAIR
jgi:colanic acid biosynthesis glycosyl transferase WcaI